MALHLVATDDRTSWLEWRRGGIGASEAAAVAGFSPFDSPTSIYLKKLGLIREDEGEQPWERAGRLCEPLIAQMFHEDTGLRVVEPQLCLEHPERPWMRATFDGLVADESGEILGPLESKSTFRWSKDWSGDQPPDYYVCQLLHQMEVYGRNRGWLAWLDRDTWRFRFREIERDPLMTDMLVSIEEGFWKRVLERRPPPVDGSEHTHEALHDAYEGAEDVPAIDLNKRDLAVVDAFRQARAERLIAEKEERAAESAVMALMEGAEVANYRGQTALKWSQHERTSVDLKALREIHGELPTTTSTYRKFWLPKGDPE